MDKSKSGTLTNRVFLRDVTQDDLPIFFEQQRDPEANRMAAFPARERKAFTAHWRRILDDDATIKQTILLDGEVAGNIVKFDSFGEPEIGYWLGRDFWGKGVATHALAAFLKQVNERPLFAHVAKHNIASMRVLKKCGFTICGEDKGYASEGEEAVEEFILRLDHTKKRARLE